MLENDLLAQLPELFASGDPSVIIGSGPDDCAHVCSPDRRLALSADAFAENVHFLPGDSPEDVAVKSLCAAVSDLAASACRPLWALVSLCLKKNAPQDWAGRFAVSLAEVARRYNLTVVGGDVTSAPSDTVISVSVVGVPLPGGPLLRSGAKPGDVIVVSGRLGGSILGRHLRPEPRVAEIAALMKFCADSAGAVAFPTACMDISDGLALDLSRLCRESGVGAVVESGLVPVSDAARELAGRSGKEPIRHALSDGEDFELLLTMPSSTWHAFAREQAALGESLFTRIGGITENGGLEMVDVLGVRQPLTPEGYQHQW